MPKKRTPYLFLLPSLALIFALGIIPIIYSFILAFGDYNGLTGYTFNGIHNFQRLFNDPYFFKSLSNIFILLIFTIPIQIFLGLVLAYMLNEKFVKWKTFFRTAFYLPVITSGVAVTFLFGQLLADSGLINNLIITFGGNALPWLEDAKLARFSMIFIIVWKGTGYYTVLFLAAMQALSEEIYEAVEIDGGGTLIKFFKITIPLLKPVIFFAVIMATINGLNTFEVPNILFGGLQGPNQVALVPGMYLYSYVITTPDYDYASAIAWFIAILSLVIAWFQFRVGDEND